MAATYCQWRLRLVCGADAATYLSSETRKVIQQTAELSYNEPSAPVTV